MKKTLIWVGEFIATVVAIILALLVVGYSTGMIVIPEENAGSVVQGNEYYATSTIHTAINGQNLLIKGGYGSVAQVTVTGAGTSAFTLFNATSTSFSHSNGLVTTSTARLATIPASLAAGTYTFDVAFTRGLLIYFDTIGTAPTTTIIYR